MMDETSATRNDDIITVDNVTSAFEDLKIALEAKHISEKTFNQMLMVDKQRTMLQSIANDCCIIINNNINLEKSCVPSNLSVTLQSLLSIFAKKSQALDSALSLLKNLT